MSASDILLMLSGPSARSGPESTRWRMTPAGVSTVLAPATRSGGEISLSSGTLQPGLSLIYAQIGQTGAYGVSTSLTLEYNCDGSYHFVTATLTGGSPTVAVNVTIASIVGITYRMFTVQTTDGSITVRVWLKLDPALLPTTYGVTSTSVHSVALARGAADIMPELPTGVVSPMIPAGTTYSSQMGTWGPSELFPLGGLDFIRAYGLTAATSTGYNLTATFNVISFMLDVTIQCNNTAVTTSLDCSINYSGFHTFGPADKSAGVMFKVDTALLRTYATYGLPTSTWYSRFVPSGSWYAMPIYSDDYAAGSAGQRFFLFNTLPSPTNILLYGKTLLTGSALTGSAFQDNWTVRLGSFTTDATQTALLTSAGTTVDIWGMGTVNATIPALSYMMLDHSIPLGSTPPVLWTTGNSVLLIG